MDCPSRVRPSIFGLVTLVFGRVPFAGAGGGGFQSSGGQSFWLQRRHRSHIGISYSTLDVRLRDSTGFGKSKLSYHAFCGLICLVIEKDRLPPSM